LGRRELSRAPDTTQWRRHGDRWRQRKPPPLEVCSRQGPVQEKQKAMYPAVLSFIWFHEKWEPAMWNSRYSKLLHKTWDEWNKLALSYVQETDFCELTACSMNCLAFTVAHPSPLLFSAVRGG
jgi:hypothetical protein